MVSIPACHAGDRGSIPRRGDNLFFHLCVYPHVRWSFCSSLSHKTHYTCCLLSVCPRPRRQTSLFQLFFSFEIVFESKVASAGNRTRAARVAGEHSTTEPPMLTHLSEVLTSCCSGVINLFIIATCIPYWSCAGPLSIVGRNSSVGRALD